MRGRPLEVAAERNGLSQFVSRNGDTLKRLRAHTLVPMVVHGRAGGRHIPLGKIHQEPFTEDDSELINTISRHIGIAFYNHRLLVSLRRKAEENRKLYNDMRQMYQDTIKAFGAAIDLKDAYTKGHSDRVARYSEAIAKEMGITGPQPRTHRGGRIPARHREDSCRPLDHQQPPPAHRARIPGVEQARDHRLRDPVEHQPPVERDSLHDQMPPRESGRHGLPAGAARGRDTARLEDRHPRRFVRRDDD